MLRIHVVRAGGYRYYVDDLVPGRAEGTLVAGEEPGVWSGAGSSALGLRGTVGSQTFAEVLDGRDPQSGASLRVARGGSVAGYDLTFAAPKSVSLLHLLATKEIAIEVGAGHQAAVIEATEYLGRVAVGVRRTRGGKVTLLPSTGTVAGHFLHRTSRSLDPHLHTHAVVANVAQGVDGRWSAVDSRRVFAHVRAAQGIYHARLRYELSDRLGAAWDVPPSGLGDVVGVDRTMRRLFSQRSAGMDEYDRRRGGPAAGSPRSRGAFHATRPDKDRTRTVESLVTEWKQRAVDFGFDLGDLTRVVGRQPAVQAGRTIDYQRVRSHLDEFAGEDRSVARRDLVAIVAAASTAGAPAQVIESVANRVAEASGPPVGADRVGRWAGLADEQPQGASPIEPRWKTRNVARAVERQAEALLGRAVLGAESVTGVDRSMGLSGRLVTRVRDPSDSLALLRTQDEPHQLGR